MTTTVDNGTLADYDVAGDVIGGAQYQYVKLLDPAPGSTSPADIATESTLSAFTAGESMADVATSIAAIQSNTGSMSQDITGPSGTTLDDIRTIAETPLRRIIQLLLALTRPFWVDLALNRVRCTGIIESGTVTTVSTVTTVTTVTGVTNFDSYQARMSVVANNQCAWASLVRARIG